MIWALTLKPGQEYTHEGLEEVHLSLASLECRPGKCPADGLDLISYLILRSGRTDQVLCTLEKGHSTQQNLDLVLQPGEKVTFSVEGSGIVYVTGYSSCPPENEAGPEEDGIERIGDEELYPFHTVVKQEPDDDLSWQEMYDEGSSGRDFKAESTTIHEAPGRPHLLEEDGQMFPVDEEEPEELNQLPVPLVTSEIIQVDGDLESLSFVPERPHLLEEDRQVSHGDEEEDRQVSHVYEEEDRQVSHGDEEEDRQVSHGDEEEDRQLSHVDEEEDRQVSHVYEEEDRQVSHGDEEEDRQVSHGDEEEDRQVSHGDEEEDRQVSHVDEEESEQLNQLSEPLVTSGILDTDGGLQSFEQEVMPGGEDMNMENQGENTGVTLSESVSDVARDSAEDLVSVSDVQQNEDTEENGHGPNVSSYKEGGVFQMSSPGQTHLYTSISWRQPRVTVKRVLPPRRDVSSHKGGVFQMSSPGKTNLNTHISRRQPSSTVKRVLPPRRGKKSAGVSHSASIGHTNQNHERTVANSISNEVCQFCGKMFISKYNRIRHEKLHAGVPPHGSVQNHDTIGGKTSGADPCVCQICGKKLCSKSYRMKHETSHARRTINNSSHTETNEVKRQTSANTLFDDRFVCQICGKSFKSKYYLTKHQKLHVPTKTQKSRVCDKMVRQNSEQNTRKVLHRKGTLKGCNCQFCGKWFRSKDLVRQHENTHTGNKPYKCKFCFKVFATKKSLREHENWHTGDKLFQCEMCGRSFSRRYRLTDHVAMHLGNRPYKCKYCDKTYISKERARYHEFTHGKDSRFTCHLCGERFCYKKHLLDHKNVHAGLTPYVCTICGEGFSLEASLKKHSQVVHKVKLRAYTPVALAL